MKRKDLSYLNGDYFYLLSSHGKGDTFMLCAFKKALEQKFGGEIIFIIIPSHSAVLECFGITTYITCEMERGDDLKDLPNITQNATLGKILPAHFIPLNKTDIIRDTFTQSWIALFDLPPNTPLNLPTNMPYLNDNLKSHLESIAPLDKIVFYLPEAHTLINIPQAIFEAECESLQSQGLTIIVNTISYDKYAYKGTINLHLPLAQAIALALSCKLVIAMRSGFCDIIAPHCKNLKAYYRTKDEIHFYSLRYNGLSKNAEEVIIDDVLYGITEIEKHLAYRFYKRIIMRGVWRKLKLPLALFRLYHRHKDIKEPMIDNLALLQTYEYQLGLSAIKIYKDFFKGGLIAFLINYPRIAKLPRMKSLVTIEIKPMPQGDSTSNLKSS